ncbi:hypothetical protein FCM35_KLT13553 [Carex littledalei]|uniref:Uncharacterized protein n=1 Tax=Carex littledalei TaxID=544730 RepID=A0A833QPF7_9POAL|nr:hypothetical protein FCM35_KLT13553 [Carex littledalei]
MRRRGARQEKHIAEERLRGDRGRKEIGRWDHMQPKVHVVSRKHRGHSQVTAVVRRPRRLLDGGAAATAASSRRLLQRCKYGAKI